MDLTKFDFYALRFVNSESVEAMAPEEIGQYVLLLCKAWLSQKDATLPDDIPYINTAARGAVSQRVLRQFPVVDTQWGPRRRNETLYGEWLRAVARSDSGRKSVEIRWNNERNTNVLPLNEVGNTKAIPIPYQSISDQTIPTQSNETCDFRNLARKFKRHFGFKPGKRPQEPTDYQKACSQYGEDYVLNFMDEWAPENMWIKEKHIKFPFNRFYQDLAENAEDDAIEAAEPKEPEIDVAAINESENAKVREQVELQLAEIQAEKELAAGIPIDQF